MSKKTSRIPSLKTLDKDCSSVSFDSDSPTLLVTSPIPEATLATAILSRALIRLNRRFQVTFAQPVMALEALNELRTKHSSSTIVVIGIDILGSKKVKKGKRPLILIGGISESEQVNISALGTEETLTPTAYVLAKSLKDTGSYDLQLAVAGVLIHNGLNGSYKGASREIMDLAEKDGVVEERKGFRLYGVGMLPLDEVFLYSTYPYIHTISGNQKACDELLIAAEIPVQKLRQPLNALNASEAQRLTLQLITRLNPEVIPQLDPEVIPLLLGKDYLLKLERESSPLRYISGFEIIANTAWARNELGASMSAWLGDRGLALRILIDTHMSHHKDVISSVQRLDAGLMGESTSSATILKMPGAKTEVLPDVGRIALSNRLVDPDRLLVLDNTESYTVVWPFSSLSTRQILRELLKKGVLPFASSSQSVTINHNPDMKEITLQMISNIGNVGD